jgi:hypothetical protein
MIIAKNIINPYLKQTTKEDTQIILEMYQVLNSTCSNKSQLIKQLINELLKHRKLICENNELQLNLYFILGLYHPTINDLFISSTGLIKQLKQQFINENDNNTSNIRIISTIMENMNRYSVNTSYHTKCKLLNELENYSKKVKYSPKCKNCSNDLDCNNGLGFCSLCKNNIKCCSRNGLSGCLDLKENFAEFKISNCDENGKIHMKYNFNPDDPKDKCRTNALHTYLSNENIKCENNSQISQIQQQLLNDVNLICEEEQEVCTNKNLPIEPITLMNNNTNNTNNINNINNINNENNENNENNITNNKT